ncbi:hypothetical protein ACFSKM_11690 [Ancylobacter dichloromethanicus]
MKFGDGLIGLFIVALGVAVFGQAQGFPKVADQFYGPGLFFRRSSRRGWSCAAPSCSPARYAPRRLRRSGSMRCPGGATGVGR